MANSEGRTPLPEIEADFAKLCEIPSDINEHLPLLRALASQCEHVTEFGVRYAFSTVALIAAQPKTLVSWDINPLAILSSEVASISNFGGRTEFQPRVGDTLRIHIEETDMLFIDSFHTGKQIKYELERHWAKVKKFLVFHDTVTFGEVGEDGQRPGILDVISWWRRTQVFPLWRPVLNLRNNNGLAVLQYEPDIEKNGLFEWPGRI